MSSSTLKKITINDLQIGMFIVEMDISWIKSPFLLHRRAIKSNNDILLLKKAGVKHLTIDLTKSQPVVQAEKPSNNEDIAEGFVDENIAEGSIAEHEQQQIKKINPESLDKPVTSLDEELDRANVLKKQANEAFQEINDLVKSGQKISVEKLSPIIDETVSSLLRNSQALLTLMHLKRYEEKLFSHSFSVMTLALTLAIKDGIEEDELKILAIAALLHDIGWAQLPLNLFGKAKKYTENELKVVQQHLKISNIIVSQSDNIHERSKQLIMLHHERNDGSGYPNAVKQEQLEPLAKILILTDYYDEIVHGLLDQPGLISSEALKLIYKESVQKKLDEIYVGLLIKLLGIYPVCSAVELTSREKGVVVEVNREKPLMPVVKIMYAPDGNALAKPLILNLKEDRKNRKIKAIVDFLDTKIDPHNLLVMAEV